MGLRVVVAGCAVFDGRIGGRDLLLVIPCGRGLGGLGWELRRRGAGDGGGGDSEDEVAGWSLSL